MAKTLCKLKKIDAKKLEALTENPTHFCLKCGRRANSKKRLCKPKQLKAKG
jgi:hypothetical protein